MNLYPFRETVASGATPDECVEQIDIGGPSMVRAAAKNHPSVAVVVSPRRYDAVRTALAAGGFTFEQRKRLAAEAFAHTAAYDVAVASWFAASYAGSEDGWPEFAGATWDQVGRAALRREPAPAGRALHATGRAASPQPSSCTARRCRTTTTSTPMPLAAPRTTSSSRRSRSSSTPTRAASPSATDVAEAHARAHACDPVSAFGGVIAANRPVSVAMAEQVAEVFTEVIVAPDYEPGAVEVLQGKKNIRILQCADGQARPRPRSVPISGGVLVQMRDHVDAEGDDPSTWTLAAGEPADAATLADLEFAWTACRAVKSNAILLAKDGASVGVGMGQVNRVDSCKLAVERAGDERATGSVAASDAFFPFADGLQVLLDAGVRAVVQPGGSVRDDESIAAAKAAGVTMYFTGTRHFFH